MPQETDAEKIARIERENDRLKQQNEQLRQEIERLRRGLEGALRAVKRQAAPFSRRLRQAHLLTPGGKPGSGFEQAAAVFGEDFAGFLVRDGWAVYRRFGKAVHQTCLAHLLRRCREMIQVVGPSAAAARFPETMKQILQRAPALRHRRSQGAIGERGLVVARGRLEAGLDLALRRPTARRPTSDQKLSHNLVPGGPQVLKPPFLLLVRHG